MREAELHERESNHIESFKERERKLKQVALQTHQKMEEKMKEVMQSLQKELEDVRQQLRVQMRDNKRLGEEKSELEVKLIVTNEELNRKVEEANKVVKYKELWEAAQTKAELLSQEVEVTLERRSSLKDDLDKAHKRIQLLEQQVNDLRVDLKKGEQERQQVERERQTMEHNLDSHRKQIKERNRTDAEGMAHSARVLGYSESLWDELKLSQEEEFRRRKEVLRQESLKRRESLGKPTSSSAPFPHQSQVIHYAQQLLSSPSQFANHNGQ